MRQSPLWRRHWAVLSVTPLLLLAACSTSPDVRTLSAPGTNFSQYQSFAFVTPLGTDRAGYQSLVSQHLKDAARRQLEARGLRYSETNPDLLVNFNASLNDKVRVTSTPEPMMGGYYGYRRGFYQPWPLYGERTDVSQYQEGTLTIDVVDARQKQLVWESTLVKAVSAKDSENIATALESAVTAAFSKYPISPPTTP